jgi:hypothetical protein
MELTLGLQYFSHSVLRMSYSLEQHEINSMEVNLGEMAVG